MAFRALMVIDASSRDLNKSIILKRSFPTVEKQCESLLGDDKYKEIPSNIIHCVFEALDLSDGFEEDYFDSEAVKKEEVVVPPVYDLFDSSYCPVVAFKKRDYIYCCMVFDEESTDITKMSLSSGVVFAHVMLENIATYLIKKDPNQKKVESLLPDIQKYVSIGFPFGVPQELNINTVLQMGLSVNTSFLPKTKGPAWRPIVFKGKSYLNIVVEEKISLDQFYESSDHCKVFGTIFCKSLLDESPEISLHLNAPLESAVLNQMVYDPSVQLVDDITPVIKNERNEDDIGQHGSRKIQFCPPVNEFPLCHYKAKMGMENIPFRCVFSMEGNEEATSIIIRLNLNEKLKNSFEKLDVLIPFFNRSPVESYRIKPQSVIVQPYPRKCGLICNLGPKLLTKSNELVLEVDATFNTTLPVVQYEKDVNSNLSYILINWRSTGATYSGLKVDSKSVEIYPQTKVKVTTVHQFNSSEYRIWSNQRNTSEESSSY